MIDVTRGLRRAMLPAPPTDLLRWTAAMWPSAWRWRRRTTPPAAIWIAPAVVLILVGAGCMYLLDPDRGGERRSAMRRRLRDWWDRGRAAGEAAVRRAQAVASAPPASTPPGQSGAARSGQAAARGA